MKYSIIIPYRDREDHLEVLIPRLQEVFREKDYEIIISEQGNDDNFQIAIVENIGYLHATGDVIVLQQVDYYPTEDVSYDFEGTAILPARRGLFLDKQNDTADIIYVEKNKFNILDVKTTNIDKLAQPPNIISSLKLANICKSLLTNEDDEKLEINYIGIHWKQKKETLNKSFFFHD